MNISDEYREQLVSEIRFCRTKMSEEQIPGMKMFYYSAIYSKISKIFNFEYDPHLQFMHLVLTTSYQSINTRLNSVLSGQSRVPISEEFFTHLVNLLERLENRIRAGQLTYDILEKISNLTYLTTGNGYYLSQKGIPVFTEE